jgi:outer membrane protein TolC
LNIATQLPALPMRIKNTAQLEQEALKNRLDLKIAKLEIDALAKQYGLVEATKYISVLEIKGIHIRDKEYGDTTKRAGFDLELAIPLYDFGALKSREAEQNYMKAVHLYLEKTVQVRSEARELHGRLQATHQLARHYQNNVLPLRETIKEENLLRYNAMIIDVLALVNDEKARIQSLMAASAAKRDYFNAEGDISAVIYGGGAISSIETSAAPKQEEKGH